MHPSTEHLAQFFKISHLPPTLQEISAPFQLLAGKVIKNLPDNPEKTECLRKLLEAKDCAVRAVVAQQNKKVPDPSEESPGWGGDGGMTYGLIDEALAESNPGLLDEDGPHEANEKRLETE